ncbi:glycosyltransferase family 39 protein [Roseibium litorale]|uniref:Glycosyltransferase family 39 protein n=1 Tax=Roseibium litorale TaxID=2803841 RepID=A0ABR9CMB5_9HYPH|nr:glycosyltransferase family 39 protein [Roseibium litorale]MBD8891990.1 glycosyltransferase family 39 protein [Roseibium litorale]
MLTTRTAILYTCAVCLVWALLPSLLFPNPPLDVVEGYAWGRSLALGYTKHPPMQAWLLEASYWLTGGGTYGAYWLSQISLGLGYLCIWQLGRRMGLNAAEACLSVLLTSVTFYFTLPAPEFNPNILQIPVWAGMILVFHRALDKGRLADWSLLGILSAFGLYTKYFAALLIGTIGLYALAVPHARRHIAAIGPWVAMAVCLVLFTPHLIWLRETDFLTLTYAANRSQAASGLADHLANPLNFLAGQLLNHAGLVLVLLTGFGANTVKVLHGLKSAPAEQGNSSTSQETRQDRLFLLWFAFLPLAVVLLASAVTGNAFKQMWGTPMFVLSGLIAVWFLRPALSLLSERRALYAAIAVQAIFLGIAAGQAVLEPLWKTKATRIHYPGKEIAQFLESEWQSRMGTPLAYVAGEMWSTANITLHGVDRPEMLLDGDPALSPWINVQDLRKRGLMLVWTGRDSLKAPGHLARFYPDAEADGSQDFSFGRSAAIPPVTLNWKIVPPDQVSE